MLESRKAEPRTGFESWCLIVSGLVLGFAAVSIVYPTCRKICYLAVASFLLVSMPGEKNSREI